MLLLRNPDTAGHRLHGFYEQGQQPGLQGSVELGYCLEQVGDETVVGYLEDRRFAVVINSDDDLAFLHTGKMLDCAGDTDRDVQVGCDDLAGLADL